MSTPNNQLPNTQPSGQSQTPPAQPQQGAGSNPPADKPAGNGDGEGQSNISLETLDPNVKAFVESELRKARLAATKAAKKEAEEAAAEKARQDAEAAAKAAGNFEQLLETEKTNHAQTQEELKKVTTELRKVKVAIKAELPNPLVNYARLIDTEDDEALLADANTLKESFGAIVHRDPNKPPATPDGKGGKNVEASTPNEKKNIDDEKLRNEVKGTGMYSKL